MVMMCLFMIFCVVVIGICVWICGFDLELYLVMIYWGVVRVFWCVFVMG